MRRSADELRLPPQAVERMLEEYAPDLPRRVRDRAVTLVGGRAAVLAGLRGVSTATAGMLESVFDRVSNWQELLERLAQVLLANVGSEPRRGLALAARLGYAHLDGAPALAAGSRLPTGPWLQDLDNGWVRVRTCWRQPLRAVLGRRAEPGRDVLHQAAAWLYQAGADDLAICLYREIGDTECAAQVIATRATMLMDLGQWATLEGWLEQLPEDALLSHPDLIYYRADIAAASGRTAPARRWFGLAAECCSQHNDLAGACRSILAASAVAADHGDLATALADAYLVGSLAEGSDLTMFRMWASWQQGRLQLMRGDVDGALVSLCRAASAASTAGESAASRPIQLAGSLALQIGDLRRQQEEHREAEAALKHAEHDALNQLLADVRTPAWESDEVLGAFGWSGAPLLLKLPGLSTPAGPPPPSRPRPLARLRRALWRTPPGPQRRSRVTRPGPDLGAVPVPVRARRGDQAADPRGPAPDPPPPHPPSVGRVPAVAEPLIMPGASAEAPRPGAATGLAVHLLGPVCAAVNNVPVGDWPSARCRSLFGFLLTHRNPWPTREALMEAFWPESPPEASRNSLNVALHGLRRTLRTATAAPVILHNGGAYGIHPELRLWLDVEEFQTRVGNGRRREEGGDARSATREYESADGLYRGDFLADDLYEDWALLTRERLRLMHLDALSRLSTLHFKAGRYAASAALCQRIVECDHCREDAHRRLMRCYSRQGQPHLALLQYRACLRALADELGVAADPATVTLHDQIRRHEPV